MFKIGDEVTIKKLSKNDKTSDFFNNSMHKYRGTTGRITHLAKNVKYIGFQTQNEYFIHFSDGKSWWWLEEWIEAPVAYNAF